jgi:hypothetical protein
MTSSKFSRQPVVQQPPPVCRSKPKPIPPTPPPPPPHTKLWITATWNGIDNNGDWRDLEITAKYAEDYPSPDGEYMLAAAFAEGFFISTINRHAHYPPWELQYEWTAPTWFVVVYGNFEFPPEPPVDIGPKDAAETIPAGQDSTFRIFTTA